ncbi:MAG: PQQ-binding-like beta-propeller repeat protein [Croceibacterium sp.]
MPNTMPSTIKRKHPSIANVSSGLTLAAALAAMAWTTSGQTQNADAAALVKDGPGKAVFLENCTSCHALGTIINAPRTSEEWRDNITKMIGLGAQVTPDEFTTIHAFLASNYNSEGAQAAPPRGGVTAASTSGPAPDTGRTYPRPSGPNQWPAHGGGPEQLNFSPLTQITPANVARLQPAWTYRYGAGQSRQGDEGIDFRFEITPLIIGGTMYISTPAAPRAPNLRASVTALRPETGEVIWKYDSPLNIHGRGLAYWPGDAATAPRLIFGTDKGMVAAIDVTTGRLAQGFGRNGMIDAYVGVASEIVGDTRRNSYTIPNPVAVYGNLLITGSRPGEAGPPAPRGDIRAWDAKTGRLVWTFHTVPQPGEPGHETYQGDSWREVSGANVWTTMTVDQENGIVFAPVGDLNSNEKATGTQLFAASLLALDAKTGKLLWHRQMVHRDMYDFDAPTPAVLIDFRKSDGKSVPAVMVTGKQGLLFIFDRKTGEPLNGWEERPTPNIVPGQEGLIWPTQPWPTAPGPLARTQMTRDEIPNIVPGMRAACQKIWDDADIVSVPLYAPRQSPLHGTVSYPSSTGGPNWGGGAYNPETGMYYIASQNRVGFRPKVASATDVGGMNRTERPAGGNQPPRSQRPQPPFTFDAGNGVYLSCGATPWGELVAVDVKNLKIAWRVPLGDTEALGARGRNTGAPTLGGAVTTQSGLVFVGGANDRKLRAFDARTGKELWETQLEASAHSTPITYMGSDGKQYVVAAAGGGTSAGGPEMSDTLVAFKLP